MAWSALVASELGLPAPVAGPMDLFPRPTEHELLPRTDLLDLSRSCDRAPADHRLGDAFKTVSARWC
eukprot:59551-Hanusia_phi.AAC.1